MKHPARLRARAARVVAAVAAGKSLQSALPAEVETASHDNAALQALVYGTVRSYIKLQALLEQLLDRPLKKRDAVMRALLLVGLFELRAGQTPDHAVVAETVNACGLLGRQHVQGLVNAVLRRFLRERVELEAAVDAVEHQRLMQPQWLHEALQSDWPEQWRQVADASNQQPPMWLRVNSLRGDAAAYGRELRDQLALDAEPHPAAPDALRLARPLPVAVLPGFAHGRVSVQDAGAQLAASLLGIQAGERVLDACAAPGGKTAHLAERSGDQASIMALDISAERLVKVQDTSRRLGLQSIKPVLGDAQSPADWWDGQPFDRILLDAPCSASGVIRRHPDIRLLRRPDDIAAMAQLQLAILAALWPLLKPRGRLLYVTCSVLRAENESVVSRFLQQTPDAAPVSLPAGLPGRAAGPGWQVLPGETGMDGFYYACLGKSQNA